MDSLFMRSYYANRRKKFPPRGKEVRGCNLAFTTDNQ